jgi:hypothetical protein
MSFKMKGCYDNARVATYRFSLRIRSVALSAFELGEWQPVTLMSFCVIIIIIRGRRGKRE